MIDIHTHLIYGVDDGPTYIGESIEMAYEAKKAGINVIIATPHFQKRIYESDKVTEYFHRLKLKVAHIGIDLYLGYEVFLNPFSVEMFDEYTDYKLVNSRYMLIELPYNASPDLGYEIILEMRNRNITPVLAHPERNRNFIRHYTDFLRLISLGCRVQVDAASILGIYGSQSKKFVKKLLDMDLVDFVASNAHFPVDYKEWYLNAYKEFTRLAGKERTSRVFGENAAKILK
ncbi:MAG: tyrosine-protein phosphatase [Acetivibrionales bacterium]|jgi:protein-tyrosine phosphatase